MNLECEETAGTHLNCVIVQSVIFVLIKERVLRFNSNIDHLRNVHKLVN
jgi:hypothetical protein